MKNKKKILIPVLVVVIIMIMSISFAWLRYQLNSNKTNIIKAGSLNLILDETSSEGILIKKAIPMSFAQGTSKDPYTFSVVNNGTSNVDYEIYLDDIELNDGEERIDDQFIRYALVKNDEELAASNSKLLSTGRKIGTSTIGTTTDKYKLYVWIDSKTKRSDVDILDENGKVVAGKIFYAKLKIEAIQSGKGGNTNLTAVERLLAKSNKTSDYSSGNPQELYEFKHDNTEQAGTLTDYRYVGKNPNNYATFNNETWRIIGIETVENETGKKEQRIKLIRDKTIGEYGWDYESGYDESNKFYTDYKSDWENASAVTLLNDLYYNRKSGKYVDHTASSGYKDVDFTVTGLNEESRNLIGKTKYYLGNYPSSYSMAKNSYMKERSNYSYDGYKTNWIGYVGLMYPSDYGYATSGGTTDSQTRCTNDITLSTWYDHSDCYTYNWLYDEVKQWFITPSDMGNSVVIVNGKLFGSTESPLYNYNMKPVVYLKADVNLLSGNGKKSNPYKFGYGSYNIGNDDYEDCEVDPSMMQTNGPGVGYKLYYSKKIKYDATTHNYSLVDPIEYTVGTDTKTLLYRYSTFSPTSTTNSAVFYITELGSDGAITKYNVATNGVCAN